jgi:hypothetical protein
MSHAPIGPLASSVILDMFYKYLPKDVMFSTVLQSHIAGNTDLTLDETKNLRSSSAHMSGNLMLHLCVVEYESPYLLEYHPAMVTQGPRPALRGHTSSTNEHQVFVEHMTIASGTQWTIR